jgi:hypothetical protein
MSVRPGADPPVGSCLALTRDRLLRAIDTVSRSTNCGHLLVLWMLAAAAFALHRVPFDDEWFSLTLASQTDWSHFWGSLANDCHPPWVALLDRALLAATRSTGALFLIRTLAVAAGLALLRRPVAAALAVDSRVLMVAAWHPIFFFYAGAARWYPFVFLASALRLSALLAERPLGRATRARFTIGALLGPAASYADLPFAAVDAVFLLWRGRTVSSNRKLLLSAALTAFAVAAPLVLSPLKVADALSAAGVGPSVGISSLKRTATWLGLGLAGEAFLPVPLVWPVLAALPAGVAQFALIRLWREGRHPLFSVWVAATAGTWIVLGLLGQVWHPRYSLLVWWIVAICVVKLLLEGQRLARILALCCLICWGLSLVATVSGRGFVKADLNALTPDVCAAIRRAGSVDFIVAPYPRTAAMLRQSCPVSVPILTLPLVRHFPDLGEQLAELRVRPAQARTLLLVEDPVTSSLAVTNERVRAEIGQRCRSDYRARTGTLPFVSFKQQVLGQTRGKRFVIERFRCADARAAP